MTSIRELLNQKHETEAKAAEPSHEQKVEQHLYEVDGVTCRRVAYFAANGMDDRTIREALLLTDEQVAFAKTTKEYVESYALQISERSQRLMELEEGWDAVEEAALGQVFSALKWMKDPKFALLAAATANKAQRRTPASNNKHIDASRVGNVIVLQMNKTFINNSQKQPGTAAIDVTPRTQEALPKRHHDIPTPKRVSELLGIGASTKDNTTELEQLAEAMGVSFQPLESDGGTS